MQQKSWLHEELERAKKQGIPVHIEGQLCHYDSAEVLSEVLEEPTYMMDYVSDDCGKIIGICFDRIYMD